MAHRSPFEILGVPVTFALDAAKLEETYYRLSKQLHPDRFAASGQRSLMAKSMEMSAMINQAFERLRTPEARLETLLDLAGALPKENAKTDEKGSIPMELAEEFFEVQEAAMEKTSDAAKRAAEFRDRVGAWEERLTGEIYALADAVNWARASGEEPRIAKILELRKERSYVRSVLENLIPVFERLKH